MTFGVYIHIPFCLQKCAYCDFHSVAMKPEDVPQREYAEAICAELAKLSAQYELRGREVSTIYFGGGTPTLLEPRNLGTILDALRSTFAVAPDAEISIEANPETLEPRNLGTLSHLFTRLSIGIQSFNDKHLQALGRIHSSATAINAVKSAQSAGFKNIGIDIMWGLNGQTIEELKDDLKQAISLNAQHISAYQLTQEPCAQEPPEELARGMFLLVHDTLTAAGFEHYEISNFARPGFRCRHNEIYWHSGEWLGLGSGATGSLRTGTRNLVRRNCSKDIKRYLEHDFTYETEAIGRKSEMAEYCFMALRTSDGIDLKDFKQKFRIEFDEAYPDLQEKWNRAGYTNSQTHKPTISLNLKGWLISDDLFQEFV